MPFPDWRTCPVYGTLCASKACRSLEFSVSYDVAFRTLVPTGEPMVTRDRERFTRFADLRIFVRLQHADTRGLALVQAALAAAGAATPYVVDATADAEDAEGNSFGAESRMYMVPNSRVSLSSFLSAVAAIQDPAPTQWYCLVIGDPKLLCLTDGKRVSGWLASLIPHDVASEQDGPHSVSTEDVVEQLFDPEQGAVSADDCDKWMNTRGDQGLAVMSAALLRRVGEPECWRESCVALSALIKFRIIGLEYYYEEVMGGGSGPAVGSPVRSMTEESIRATDEADLMSAFAALRGAASLGCGGTLVIDILHFVFASVVRRSVLYTC
jgi:hypothetical protein